MQEFAHIQGWSIRSYHYLLPVEDDATSRWLRFRRLDVDSALVVPGREFVFQLIDEDDRTDWISLDTRANVRSWSVPGPARTICFQPGELKEAARFELEKVGLALDEFVVLDERTTPDKMVWGHRTED